MYPTKMTTIERFHEMKSSILGSLESATIEDSADIHTRLAHLQPTVQDFLKLAYYERKIEGPIGMCGNSCDGTCETCDHHTRLLDEHYSNNKHEKEIDDLLDTSNLYLCTTCESECVPYDVEGDTFWLCESCYFGNELGDCDMGCCVYDHSDEV